MELESTSDRDHKTHTLLSAQIHALELIAAGAPLPDVLATIARTIEEQSARETVVAIFLVDSTGNRLHVAAAPSLPDAASLAVDATADLPPAEGLASAWSMPILSSEGKTLGTIGTYFRTRREPTDRERQIVEMFCRTTSLAIERLAADEAARQSKERMELVVRSAKVGVWYCPLPFDVLHWDARVKEHFHLAPDANVTIDTFYERLHPDDRERTRTAIAESIATRTSYDIDYRTVSPDGASVKWIRAVGRAFYDDDGNPLQFDGVTVDITDRKTAEEALRESELGFRALAEERRRTAEMLHRHVASLCSLRR